MMRALTLSELEAAADELDSAVAQTPGIDRFCSSSAWVLSAAEALMPAREPWVHQGDHGWVAMMRGRHSSGLSYVEPLELAWGLASPLVGVDAAGVADQIIALIAARVGEIQVALVPGLAGDAPILRALLGRMPQAWERRWGQPTLRHVAHLGGGVDGFLARRSRNFRKALRQAGRHATSGGVTFESVRCRDADAADALYDRIQAVEARSWKAQGGVGITSGPMRDFYHRMLRRLARHDRQRTIFARQGDRDIAYVLGAVFAGEYRGLQFSYDDEESRFSLGSMCQLQQITELCDEGILRYDLGTDMEYKRRWAEEQFQTTLLVIIPR
jgi:CelD/BcsL family acetyltransferase involved in cellulose biosynthesis